MTVKLSLLLYPSKGRIGVPHLGGQTFSKGWVLATVQITLGFCGSLGPPTVHMGPAAQATVCPNYAFPLPILRGQVRALERMQSLRRISLYQSMLCRRPRETLQRSPSLDDIPNGPKPAYIVPVCGLPHCSPSPVLWVGLWLLLDHSKISTHILHTWIRCGSGP